MTSSRSLTDLPSRAALATLLWLALSCFLAVASAKAEPAPENLREQAQSILADPKYQTEWPDGEDARRRQRGSRRAATVPGAAATGFLAQALIWTLLGVVVIVLLSVFAQEVIKRRQGSEELTVDSLGELSDSPSAPRPRLVEAERLAAAGRYGEAVHLLLLIAVDRLKRQRSQGLEDSLTSREILRRLRLSPPGRTALERLVLGTERFLFAEESVNRQEFDACREAFRQLESITP